MQLTNRSGATRYKGVPAMILGAGAVAFGLYVAANNVRKYAHPDVDVPPLVAQVSDLEQKLQSSLDSLSENSVDYSERDVSADPVEYIMTVSDYRSNISMARDIAGIGVIAGTILTFGGIGIGLFGLSKHNESRAQHFGQETLSHSLQIEY